MSGIIGFVTPNNREQATALLTAMAEALKTRQQDQLDLYHHHTCGLGRVNSGILNPETQPIWNEDHSLGIVMEGEIYDYQTLKQELITAGYQFKVNNDVEFILCLYQKYGSDFAAKLNGAFVAAIWDVKENTLLITNDRFGLYPLYYAHYKNRFLFASGVRALLADKTLSRSVDTVAIAQMLSFEHLMGSHTLLQAVQVLPPACVLTYQNDTISLRSYWQLVFANCSPPLTEEAYLEGLIHYLRQSVSRQANDNYPTGILLSGGLDSRMIIGLLAWAANKSPLYSFTFGIPGCDDARLAEEIAHQVGSTHQFMALSPDYLLDAAEKAVQLTDGMVSCIHIHAFANLQARAQLVKVIYKGYMGDSLAGSHLNRQHWAHYNDKALTQMLFAHYNRIFPVSDHDRLFTEAFKHQLANGVSDSFQSALAESKAELAANTVDQFDLRQRQRRFILTGVDLVRSQVAVRTPFCDNDLVEFMLTVPPGLRLDRYLFIKALIRMFPKLAKIPWEATGYPLSLCARDLLLRSNLQIRWWLRNRGFNQVPIPGKKPYANYNIWMRTALCNWVEETLLSQPALERGYFNPDCIRNLVAEQKAGANHASKLGVLLALELWHRQNIDCG